LVTSKQKCTQNENFHRSSNKHKNFSYWLVKAST